jgi:hypothetical protein
MMYTAISLSILYTTLLLAPPSILLIHELGHLIEHGDSHRHTHTGITDHSHGMAIDSAVAFASREEPSGQDRAQMVAVLFLSLGFSPVDPIRMTTEIHGEPLFAALLSLLMQNSPSPPSPPPKHVSFHS